ncbi:MAG: penicillin-binding protein 2 [Candidatus Omnitrophica bacterium]|nr:penicillin-binding protein 2 [Candidatus Omnitrophota bacterium]
MSLSVLSQFRMRRLQWMLYLAMLALGVGLARLQLWQGELYREKSDRNRIRLLIQLAERGRILDTQGRVLASDRTALDVLVLPQQSGERAEVAAKLSTLLGIPSEELLRVYKRNYEAPFVPVPLVRDLRVPQAAAVEESWLDLPGVFVRPRPQREYPYGASTAHAVGYVGRITREEYRKWVEYGYRPRDLVGRAGVEARYDSYLRGREGGQQVEVDNRSRMVRILGERPSTPGKEITLTLDAELQELLSAQMHEMAGAAVVLNCRTGAVLALVSVPGFDSNLFSLAATGSQYHDVALRENQLSALFQDPGIPLLPRAVAGEYPLGSIQKVLVGAVGLHLHEFDANTRVTCRGSLQLGNQTFRCWYERGHGPVNLQSALEHSCNIYFYELGRRIGIRRLSVWAGHFGLGRAPGLMPGEEKSGLFPDRQWKRAELGEPWYEGDTLNVSIGQGAVLATPVQAACMIAAVANGGYLPQPYLLQAIEGMDVTDPVLRPVGIGDEVFREAREGMRRAVESEQGTGQHAFVAKGLTAGKTGTVQVPQGSPHGWFVGFSPVDDPQWAIAVLVEHAGQGGGAPAVLGHQIVQYLNDAGYL